MTFIDSILLAVGLSMDAACVSSTNGLAYRPSLYTLLKFSLFFGIFQAIMPLLGYAIIRCLAIDISSFTPYIALIILTILGAKMIKDSFSKDENNLANAADQLTTKLIIIQAIATSIDALSVGTFLTGIAIIEMLEISIIIGLTTFIICILSGILGTKIGKPFNKQAEILGGIVLIFLGLKIFIGS
ncbi:MAG: hypothetical protein ATN31_08675 [Candidatus Epulonipiscioides saccharophilum]|nr:MAG: hypothetical protein ATN31_08675 [Epulopiscium sp. AS2M-Bin001]